MSSAPLNCQSIILTHIGMMQCLIDRYKRNLNIIFIKYIYIFSHRQFLFWIGRIIGRQSKGKRVKEFDTRMVWSRSRLGIALPKSKYYHDRWWRWSVLCIRHWDMRHDSFVFLVLFCLTRTWRILKSFIDEESNALAEWHPVSINLCGETLNWIHFKI